MNSMSFRDLASAVLERKANPNHEVVLAGRFDVELYRRGERIHKEQVQNGIVNVGLNYALGAIFRSLAQVNPWYIGLINHSPVPTFAATDTSSTNNFTEFTGYDEANRVDWGEDAAASQSITNSTAATFTINGSATLNGIFLDSVATKSDTTGTLWSTASFAATLAVVATDVVKITYTVNAV